MAENTRTSLPWIYQGMGEVIDADGHTICFVRNHDGSEDSSVYAALIVRAVNSYDRLVECLQRLVDETDPGIDGDYNPHAAPLAPAVALLKELGK